MLEKLEKFQILALAVVLALGGIIGAKIITDAMAKDVIYVTGSFSQNVISDSGRFEFTIHSRQVNKAQCFSTLNKQRPLVIKYLKDKGFAENDIDIKALQGYDVYNINSNGMTTNQVIAYDATQRISVKSKDVQKIKTVSNEITDLIQQGIDIGVEEPSYFYSKLPDLKVKMLEEATKDAKQRASAMLKATHNRVGKIQSVNMGVFQITPVDSTNVSDSGISDTTSIEKKITSVANVTFRVK